MKKRKTPSLYDTGREVSANNNRFKVYLSYIGEGYTDCYDKNDPDDEPLLRIDIHTKEEEDKRRWIAESCYSSCTGLSAKVTADKAKEMCKKVLVELNKLTDSDIERCGEFCFQKAWENALM